MPLSIQSVNFLLFNEGKLPNLTVPITVNPPLKLYRNVEDEKKKELCFLITLSFHPFIPI